MSDPWLRVRPPLIEDLALRNSSPRHRCWQPEPVPTWRDALMLAALRAFWKLAEARDKRLA